MGTPELELSQSSFDYYLEMAQYDVKTLTISNDGESGSLLDYEVSKPDSVDWLLLSSDSGLLNGILEGGELARIHLQALFIWRKGNQAHSHNGNGYAESNYKKLD